MTSCFSHRVRPLARALVAVPLVAGLLAGNAVAAKLSGNVINRGPGSGTYFVYVVRLSISNPVVGSTILAAPGPWEISGVPNGTYYVVAWQDQNGNMIPSRGEPIGYYGIPFPNRVIVSGQDVGGLNVELGTFSIAAEIRGNVTYGGSQTGRIWVVPHFGQDLSLANTRGTPWTMTQLGEYQVFVFSDDTYYVSAFMDVNGNLIYDQGEPVGTAGPLHVQVTPSATYYANIVMSVNTTSVRERTWSRIKELYQP